MNWMNLSWFLLPISIQFFLLWQYEKHEINRIKKHFGELYKDYEKLSKKYEKEQRKNLTAGIRSRLKK
jgi:hypothetical protein